MGDKVEVSTLVLSQVRERASAFPASTHLLCDLARLRSGRRAVTGVMLAERGFWRVWASSPAALVRDARPDPGDGLRSRRTEGTRLARRPASCSASDKPSRFGPTHGHLAARGAPHVAFALLQAGPVELQQTGADQGYLRPLVPVAVSHQHEPVSPSPKHTPSPLCCSAAPHIAHTKPPSLPIIDVTINT